jgi:hypothetical protein
VALPWRVRLTLGAACAVLLAGLLGLGLWLWWCWRHHPVGQPADRYRLARIVAVTAGLVLIAVGTMARLAVAVEPVASCTPPGGQQAATPTSLALLGEQAATWPETGLGLLYARSGGARVCVSRAANFYVAVHANNPAGARAMNLGDIVITPGFGYSRERLREVVDHEARHRAQWAVGTLVAGPLAFPLAYAVDDFFFPGARNHFERLAGLETGGYEHEGHGPVLGPAQYAALALLVAVGVVLVLVVRRRRASLRATPPASGTGAPAGSPPSPRRRPTPPA